MDQPPAPPARLRRDPEPSEQRTYNLEFSSTGDFADAVDQAFVHGSGTR